VPDTGQYPERNIALAENLVEPVFDANGRVERPARQQALLRWKQLLTALS
jgi:hypothetical protein